MNGQELFAEMQTYAGDDDEIMEFFNHLMTNNAPQVLALVTRLSATNEVQDVLKSIVQNNGNLHDVESEFAKEPEEMVGEIDDREPADMTPLAVLRPRANTRDTDQDEATPPSAGKRRLPEISKKAIVIGVIAIIILILLAVAAPAIGQMLKANGIDINTPFQPSSQPQAGGQPTAGSPPQPQGRGQPTPGSILPIQETKPPPPIVKPLDLQNAPFLSSTQLFFIVTALLALIWGLLDAGERREIKDWVAVLIAIVIVLFTSRAGVLQALFNAIGLNNPKALVAISLLAVVLVSLTAGRDLTPVGLFFKLLASGALILGSMGELQSALSLKSGAVLPFEQILAFIQLKQMDTVWFSLWVYGLNILAFAVFLFEIFSPRSGSSEWGSLLSALIIVPVYFLCRILAGWDMLPSLLVANALGVVLASISRNWGLSTGVIANRPYGEVQIVGRFQVRTPWDGLLTGLVFLEILVMAIGTA